MQEIIEKDKFIELTYKVTDKKTGEVLSYVDFPLSYVHGATTVLSPQVTDELDGKAVGDVIELPIDCDKIYGPRDESLVFTDHLENVPEEYREVGASILMESETGASKEFIVTRMDEKTLTVDGNNPMCGRDVIFTLEVLTIRDATEEEIEIGGATDANPDIEEILQH